MINLRGFIVLALVCLAWSAALAHDHGRPELDGWFNQLKSGQGLCCSNNDGTALEETDWEIRKGKYWVFVPLIGYLSDEQKAAGAKQEMGWVMVPDDAVITEPNKAGRTMVWPTYGVIGVSIRCFMPGSMI